MSDKDLDETIGTYISQLKDALKEQSARKQAKFDEVRDCLLYTSDAADE